MNNNEFLGRRSIRLKGYDYTQAGGYFVTIITLWRECLFGEIAGGEMRFNALGRIVEECWHAIPEHFPNTDVGVFVVMPNHVHGIIIIHNETRIGTMPIAGARHASPIPPHGTLSRGTMYLSGTMYRAPTPRIEQFGKPTVGSLPTIIRTFKAAVTRCAGRELNSANIWQRNYHEHILRDQHDYERIAGYIAANPVNWADDEENLNRLQSPDEQRGEHE